MTDIALVVSALHSRVDMLSNIVKQQQEVIDELRTQQILNGQTCSRTWEHPIITRVDRELGYVGQHK